MKINQSGKIRITLLLLFLFITAFSRPASAAKTKFRVSVKRTRLLVSEQMQIKCKKSKYMTYTFRSTKEKVASVSEEGLITACKEGETVIIVNGIYHKKKKIQRWFAKFRLEVFECRLNEQNLSLKQGSSFKLKIIGNTLKRKVKWTSSNKAIATVSKKGKVTTKQDGNVTIECRVGNILVLQCNIAIIAKELPAMYVPMMVNRRYIYGSINLASEIRKNKKIKSKITYRIANPANGHMKGNIYYADREGRNTVTAFGGKYKKTFNITQHSWCAHRGYLDMYPENTVDAYEAAGLYGAGFVEADIRVSADGKIVCCHNASLENMTGVPLKIQKLTYNEIKSYEINNGNGLSSCKHKYVPLLSEYLSICRKYKMVPVLELKHLGTNEEMKKKAIREIVKQLKKYGLNKTALVVANGALADDVPTHAEMLALFRKVAGKSIMIAALDSRCWKVIKDLPNAYRRASQTPKGSFEIIDYCPLYGRKGKSWKQYLRSSPSEVK